ncbi:MAG: CRISPR-associated endonuclease Cas2 [Lachnospiraceae bacterium]|nr:CRISPR-associated endonuclease Cas2 [Lachnospiraceae bacterium]
MRVVVFFDLPTITDKDKKEYRRFRKLLIRNGFVMMQESVYVKMVLNQTVQNSVIKLLKKSRSANGLVQALIVTEKQFSNIVNIAGKFETNVVDTDERLVIL